MNTLYRTFRSVRLAIVLLLVITTLSIFATLIPQGRDQAFYQASYSPGVYRLVTALALDRFFGSILFLIPVLLFTANLAVCAVDRFVRRARSSTKKRYGPDIVHIGLLLLIVGSLVTVLARQEKDFSLASGQEAPLNATWSIRLLSTQFQRYENGTPKAWISTVQVTRAGKSETTIFPIRVNHPLRLPGIAVYQTNWEDAGTITLKDSLGREANGRPGQGLQDGASFWLFSGILKDGEILRAEFKEYQGQKEVSTRLLAPADRIGPYTVARIESLPTSGLKSVSDPGYVVVIAALIILAVGLGLTYFQKSREERS